MIYIKHDQGEWIVESTIRQQPLTVEEFHAKLKMKEFIHVILIEVNTSVNASNQRLETTCAKLPGFAAKNELSTVFIAPHNLNVSVITNVSQEQAKRLGILDQFIIPQLDLIDKENQKISEQYKQQLMTAAMQLITKEKQQPNQSDSTNQDSQDSQDDHSSNVYQMPQQDLP